MSMTARLKKLASDISDAIEEAESLGAREISETLHPVKAEVQRVIEARLDECLIDPPPLLQ